MSGFHMTYRRKSAGAEKHARTAMRRSLRHLVVSRPFFARDWAVVLRLLQAASGGREEEPEGESETRQEQNRLGGLVFGRLYVWEGTELRCVHSERGIRGRRSVM